MYILFMKAIGYHAEKLQRILRKACKKSHFRIVSKNRKYKSGYDI